jgi:YVTN family beta-propeller protein
MGNHLRRIPWSKLLAWDQRKANALGSVHSLGDETGPGGDPGPVLSTQSGAIIVALSGVDRVAINRDPSRPYVYRTSVGGNPSAMILSPDETRLYVANRFSDSISVLDVESMQALEEISLGAQPVLEATDRGERLFHDATLSRRGWFSCHSCHTGGHTNGQLNDNLGDDNFGAPKKILSLLGAGDTAPYSWKGSVERLEDQILKSLSKTMLHEGPNQQMAIDLAAFIRTLQPPPSIREARGSLVREAIARGGRVFESQDCNRCHQGAAFTSKRTYDVGMPDETGHTDFNPPSLRGLSQRDAYFHDNRAKSIKEALATHKHPNGETELSKEDLADLLAFLESL